MSKGKKTFIFYSDWINMVREMPDKDAGELLKHILNYVNDENPVSKNLLVKMAFGHMKPLLKADLVKWENIRGERKKAGAKGGKANAKQKKANAKQVEAVNDNVNVNVNDNTNVNEKDKGIYSDNVFLKITEYNHLLTKIGAESTDKYIERLSNYLHSTGKEYKSHYHTILNWISNDEEKNVPSENRFKNQVA